MKNLNKILSFYKGKRVLITGHTGFKGGWLSTWLNLLGADVYGYSIKPPSFPSFYEAINSDTTLNKQLNDNNILDYTNLCQIFNKFNPEFVFHLAAQPLVRQSYVDPIETIKTNVLGSSFVFEVARSTPSVRALINVTSDKCYDNKEWEWGYRENDRLGGKDPYSASKACSELIFDAYNRSFFLNSNLAAASVRAGNVIGGGDWGKDRLVPDCIRSFHQEESVVLRYPKAVRPWQHVLEPLSGYLMLAAKLYEDGSQYSGGWNFGPSSVEKWNVERIVNEVSQLWGNGKYSVTHESEPAEANWLHLDCSKANLKLKWKPKYSVKDALRETIDWYKLYYQGTSPQKMLEFSIKQITNYMQ